ncbi:sugar phosphate isomerase/epimerase [Pullulanibacillus sp. KACC 23026]|uniref:sugar phosphate isomerase/epimerase family protein n=1 Tax=Pullulanibacillus sp. KACC 23026 TaxID=3028315 RepID=UPI0023AFCEFB|nr:sugar phosphate isomerase/epimerase [Pullulanibacillus sp. KACC 23026]WEG14684.1 sugar phosphate isomerase/epimerase [Pullulanibacillus sp. KACC 23026]
MTKIGMRIPSKIGALGMDGLAEWASQIGLDVIDVPKYDIEVKTVLEKYGLEVGSIDGTGAVGSTKLLSKNETDRAEAVSALKSQLTEVSELGGQIIFICLVPEDPNQSRASSFDIWKETFPELVKHAESCNVYFALEGWPGPAPTHPTIGCTPEMWRAMLEAIPSKHFGINYDPSHLVRLRVDYLRALEEFGERITYCHGKDTEILPEELYESGTLPATFGTKYAFSEGGWRYTIPGQGTVDWGKVAVRLEKFGYTGNVGIELEDHRFWGSLEAEQNGIIKAKEHLQLYFK